jgi:hypothetical protein
MIQCIAVPSNGLRILDKKMASSVELMAHFCGLLAKWLIFSIGDDRQA